MAIQRRTWKWLCGYGLLFLVICLFLYYYHDIYHSFRVARHFFSDKERLNHFITSFGFYAPLVFISLQMLQVVFAPIPGELTGFIRGYLFGIVPGFIYSSVGLTLGSMFAFLLSRHLGMPFVHRFVGQETMRKFDRLMERQGPFFHFSFSSFPVYQKTIFAFSWG
jgi:uncharacterized membrane protein YdjX (TVP38/TMEM64 family)